MEDSKLTKPSEGFFLAKRAMVESIDRRLGILHKEYVDLPKNSDTVDRARALSVEMQTLEYTRNYIRNILLWDTSKGQ